VITSIGTSTIAISRPSRRVLCGTSARAEPITISNSVARVSAARARRNADRSLLSLRIGARLIDTATKSSPVSAAAAAIIAVKNAVQAFGAYPSITSTFVKAG
jgi:hypothetical protein